MCTRERLLVQSSTGRGCLSINSMRVKSKYIWEADVANGYSSDHYLSNNFADLLMPFAPIPTSEKYYIQRARGHQETHPR